VGWPHVATCSPARMAAGTLIVMTRSARSTLADLTATAESPDGMVVVTVGVFGDLRALRLDPGLYRSPDAPGVAACILAAVRAAAADVTAQAHGLVAAQLPAGTRPQQADVLFGPILHELDRRIGMRS
jgi:DNA-binding protein YbaB